MRMRFGRWLAVIAVVAGVSVGASALPTSAGAAPAKTTTTTTHHTRPADWWF